MSIFVEGFLTILIAAGFAAGAGLVALILPIALDKIFVRNPPPINTGPVMFGVALAVITFVTAWPILSWLWWPQ